MHPAGSVAVLNQTLIQLKSTPVQTRYDQAEEFFVLSADLLDANEWTWAFVAVGLVGRIKN
jgi:hypothetical protein